MEPAWPSAPDPATRARLAAEVSRRYAAAAQDPTGMFAYPVGRAGAEALGYAAADLAAVPEPVLARFLGVGNPFAMRRPATGERVLDVGCGAGVDVAIAARCVGPNGCVVGLDRTPAMLAVAAPLAAVPGTRVQLLVGDAAALPFAAASFDQVLGNGALNLVLDKEPMLHELARVLRPGGTLALADLVLGDDAPAAALAGEDAWSHGIAGALPGRSVPDLLRAAGFASARLVAPTGVATSPFTAAWSIHAVR